MALSIAGLNPVSSIAVTPKQQAYNIYNESAVSSSYRESVKNTVTPQAVRGPAPVQYASKRYGVTSSESLNANRRMTRAYNNIAATFGGASTSYGSDMQASSYNTTGIGYDMFA